MATAGMAQTSRMYDDIRVVLDQMPEASGYSPTSHGYVEYGATVINRSSTRTHSVELRMPANVYRRGGHNITQMTRRIKLAPGAAAKVYMWQPAVQLAGNQMAVVIDGERQKKTIWAADTQHGEGGGNITFLASSSLDRSIQNSLNNEAKTGGSRHWRGSGDTAFRLESPITEWSPNWLAYSRFDGVVITVTDVRRMPANVLSALRKYVECGGSLLVSGTKSLPESLLKGGIDDGSGGVYLGFGRCTTFFASTADWGRLVRILRATRSPWNSQTDISDANRKFPVVDDFQIPVRGLFILMLVFALVIGPLNIYLLSKWKKRIWLLWNVPAVSLLTVLAVFAYATLAEGWDRHRRTQGLTLLDENSHRATTIGLTAYYCPVTPGGGLLFDTDTELNPQIFSGNSYYNREGSSAKIIDWTNGQHLASGWVTARIPSHFMVRRTQQRRERLVVRTDDGGSLVVVNGLGARIISLQVADTEGTIWAASDEIPAGAEAKLTAQPGKAAHLKPDALRSLYRSDWTQLITDRKSRANNALAPGRYVATVEGSPFMQDGLSDAEVRQGNSIVIGIMKRDENGS